MLSTTRSPSPHRPSRVVSGVLLGTALALAGAGTASAVTAGSAGGQAATAAYEGTTHQDITQSLDSGHAAVAVAAPSLGHGWQVTHRAKARVKARARAKAAPAKAAAARRSLGTWNGVQRAWSGVATGPLPASQELMPVSTSGSQSYLPMTPARMANATTIVRQTLHKHMGLRSAVIAVATAMQESQLLNIGYGTYDSLGLFQQRPSAGWGSPAEIMDPVYASDAFLNALQGYQAHHPGWAGQPLWEAAQGVQDSGFPYAYAQWENEAAHVVATVARGMF